MWSMSGKMSALKKTHPEISTWNRMASLGSPSAVRQQLQWVRVEFEAMHDCCSILLHRAYV
jgi:hypothetical protein